MATDDNDDDDDIIVIPNGEILAPNGEIFAPNGEMLAPWALLLSSSLLFPPPSHLSDRFVREFGCMFVGLSLDVRRVSILFVVICSLAFANSGNWSLVLE